MEEQRESNEGLFSFTTMRNFFSKASTFTCTTILSVERERDRKKEF